MTEDEALAQLASDICTLPGNPRGDRTLRPNCGGYTTRTGRRPGTIRVHGGRFKGWREFTLAEAKEFFFGEKPAAPDPGPPEAA